MDKANEYADMDGGMPDDPGGTSIENCYKCKSIIDDVRAVAKCTGCENVYHAKCENVDLRGFHMRKCSWKCGKCSENKPENVGGRARKRSRVDDNIDQSVIEAMSETLQLVLKNTNELTKKVDQLLAENQILRLEIAKLKENPSSSSSNSLVSYASVVCNKSNQTNDSKVLLIKQKSQQKDIKQIKIDLKEKVNPVELGVGVAIGRPTKNGSLILSCGMEKDINSVQSEIQTRLGTEYEVDRPKKHEHRIKVVGVNACEHGIDDEEIVNRVIKQNDLNKNDISFNMKILRKTNVVNNKFNIIFEADSNTYNLLINKQRLNLGWNRCPVYNEYGIIRCYHCNKFGHLQKECKDKQICAKCTGEHDSRECQEVNVKCINCIVSNQKYGLNLKTNHTVWDVANCETLKRIEKMQKNKFLQ